MVSNALNLLLTRALVDMRNRFVMFMIVVFLACLPHPPFGHLLLKEKEKGLFAFYRDDQLAL